MSLRIKYDKLVDLFEEKVVELIDFDTANLVVKGVEVIDISSSELFLNGHAIKYLSPRMIFTSEDDSYQLWGFQTWAMMEELIDLVDTLSHKASQQRLQTA